MSLIEEALRRVQDPVAGNKPPTPAQTAPKNQAPPLPVTDIAAETAHSWQVNPQAIKTSKAHPPSKDSANRSLVLLTASLVTLVSVLWILGFLFVKPAGLIKSTAKMNSKGAISSGPEASPAMKNATAAGSGESSVKQFKLTGVVIGKGDSYAVIDGRIVGKGESIEGATVIEINESSTELQLSDGTKKVLRVPR